MLKKIVFLTVCILSVRGFLYAAAIRPEVSFGGAIEPIQKTDRILVLAPHPDDEAIACSGIIQEAVAKGADLKVAYLTNGDHNQVSFIVYEKRITLRRSEFIHMGEVRRREAIKAMKLLGVEKKDLIFLGYPDFGTFTIFREFWGKVKPYKSMLTRISKVPYKDNFSFGAPYKGESILSDLEKILREYKPNKIFVSHPADANVDHKAFYLFLQVALHSLGKEMPKPQIYPYLVHCIGWPIPRHYHPGLSLDPPAPFLESQLKWSRFYLTKEQLDKKHECILCYRSQTSSSAFYLLAFARRNELFGDYPRLELKEEESVKGRLAKYFGFSRMFNVSKQVDWEDPANLAAGKGTVSYGLSGEDLLIRVDNPQGLNKKSNIQLYIFGCSDKMPFARMPKIRIITKNRNFKVFDGKKLIKVEGLTMDLTQGALTLKVPLEALGGPDFILTAVKTYAGLLHTDTTSFRKVNIKLRSRSNAGI